MGSGWRMATLGGALPDQEQWRQAAGTWQPTWPGALAINRVRAGPVAVGTSADDRTPDSLRDLAGNVSEWTRNVSPSGTVPLTDEQIDIGKGVIILGRNFADASPAGFAEPHVGAGYEPQTEDEISLIGFRVVIGL